MRGQEGGSFWKTWGRMKKASICVSSRENSNVPTTIASYTPYALQSGASRGGSGISC